MDSRQRPPLLHMLLDSLLAQEVDEIYVSISFKDAIFDAAAQQETRDGLERVAAEHSNVHLFWQPTQCYQFDHLRYLYSVYDGDDSILFIDDDDLLLALPPLYKEYDIVEGRGIANGEAYVRSGAQCRVSDKLMCPILSERLTHTDVQHKYGEAMLEDPAATKGWPEFLPVQDFSGYIVRHRHLAGFFPKHFQPLDRTTIPHRVLQLFDVKFTSDYLRNVPDVRTLAWENTDAFVYYRLWAAEDRPVSAWRVVS
jgi:hypothetical protein